MVRVILSEAVFLRRSVGSPSSLNAQMEIPPPAGENAGVRDDTVKMGREKTPREQ